ncbi:sensor signal transduction histidine kinase [Thermoclostridium stercorarium subsp. stercorarium DSM 8532]|uniref:histidine kinase n=3 Tax=Thermoclostridium stercorarium TaxID=1510 RepID=L7VVS7_THES1|nr:histidine kinase N-terminal 7TM domain-containing protein [Thermoclostridium stercorarium]AGC69628.1 sensor signal transduction histidine kinase [Thermoclostridium stercorarium subsp. stercorarium DSM 8532]AGI40580.1 histidine kinase [Thermoclostridium stercorarium subsp. stercorarium DSM 8532]ANW99853.1 histidine kinase [Thermoclostridium stercorarium subsp. thermolacticum DSM 2910]ANX02478.1 histidine kinase [Thermoclostridium stercorarium subsp. leptospartum DSM 9219]UZQ85564.1 histidine
MNKAGVLIQVICAVLAGMILAYLFANGRRCKTTYSYMLCIGLLLFWNIAEIMLLMSENLKQEMLALKIKFVPVVYIGVSWLNFCLTIANKKIVKHRLYKYIIILFPAVCYAFLLTNEFHRLFYKEVIFGIRMVRGPVFWIHTVESYFCIITGTVVLINRLRKVEKSLDKKVLFALSLFIPLTANILMLADVLPIRGFDVTAQLLLVTLVITGVVVYQKKFLNLIPVAARHFIENMSDGIVIIDNENTIVGLNDAVNWIMPELKLNIYDSAVKLSEYIRNSADGEMRDKVADAIELPAEACPVKGNLEIAGVNVSVEIGVLRGFNQSFNGKIVIFEDRSEEHKLLNEIKNKNILLTHVNERLLQVNKMLSEANHRLEQYSRTAEELAVARERNRMGREVHDTVGHTLTLLIAMAENIRSKLQDEQEELKKMIDKSIEISKEALNDIRNYLKGQYAGSFKNTGLDEWLKDLSNDHIASGVKIDVSIDESLSEIDTARAMAIYRICQESVTNAIRHGHAKTVNIIIKSNSGGIKLYIIDDGKGCSEIVKGYGLTGMEERVARFGGTISFGSDGENGFSVIAYIPV